MSDRLKEKPTTKCFGKVLGHHKPPESFNALGLDSLTLWNLPEGWNSIFPRNILSFGVSMMMMESAD